MEVLEHKARHDFEPHTSDVRVRLRAPTVPELFVEAALALADLLGADVERRAVGQPERVHVRAADQPSLLVAWLDALIHRSESSGCVFTQVSVERLTDRELVASIRGYSPGALRTHVKTATYHDLRIEPDPRNGFSGTVVLDV